MSATIDLEGPKARQILDGAKDAFLEMGYEGASTDAIARRAGVSKGTLYNYFPDKRTLFAAFVEDQCREQARLIFNVDAAPHNIKEALHAIAYNYIELMISPFMQGIFRVVVAEAERFPELARSFYDSGPDIGHRRLSQLLAAAVARGELVIDDIDLAANQFIQLGRSDLFFKRLFCIRKNFSKAEIERVADGAVEMFLKTYAARS